jgi:photosystem II stability/assembly factor-like uncharacterized protein
MKKFLLSFLSITLISFVFIIFFNSNKSEEKDTKVADLRNKHKEHLKNSPFKETYKLTKKERKAKGLPPNKYYERQWELTMNPELGRPTPENLREIKDNVKVLREESNLSGRISGDDISNSWTERGPNNVGGRTRALMFDPNDPDQKIVFAGGVSGGLWRNPDITDANSVWTQIETTENLNISSIAVDPNNSNIFYLGTGESYTGPDDASGNGVWKSINGGATWFNVFDGELVIDGENIGPRRQYINDIVVRNNGGVSEVYFAGNPSVYYQNGNSIGSIRGLFKSVDGGDKWEFYLDDYIPNDIEIGADNKLWVSTRQGEIFVSTDSEAENFELKYTVPNASRVQIEASKSNAGTLYFLAQGRTSPVIMGKTTNGFGSVNTMSLPDDVDNGIPANDFTRGQAFYDLLLAVDPSNESKLYAGGIDLFRSSNTGNSWGQISKWSNNNALFNLDVSPVHADQHAIAFANGSSRRMIFGNDGGVYYSNDGGATILSRNKGYNTSQFYTIGVAPTIAGGDYFAGGLQDNGTQGFVNAQSGIVNAKEFQGGDGAGTDYSQTKNYLIANFVYNNSINVYNRDGGYIGPLNNSNDNIGDFINQQALDYNLDKLYTNYTERNSSVYRIARYDVDENTNKTILSDGKLNSSPTSFKVSPFVTSQTNLYIGTDEGDLVKLLAADKGRFSMVWSSIKGPNFVGSVSDIEFGASENEIFVTMKNYGVENIWYTNDGGGSWSEKEGNLPDFPVNSILQNPLNTEEVIVGTQLGIWYTNNFSSDSPDWLPAFNGMSNVKVTDLDMRDDYAVYAATYGRGVFSGQFTAETLSINNNEVAENSVVVYPTSSNGNIFIKSTLNYSDSNLSVYDINGRLAYNSTLELFSNTEASLNLSNLSTGMYFVNISAENLNKTVKIIIK